MTGFVCGTDLSAVQQNRVAEPPWPRSTRGLIQGAGFRVQGSGCRVQGAGVRVQGSGFRVQGAGCRPDPAAERVPHLRGGEGLERGQPHLCLDVIDVD